MDGPLRFVPFPRPMVWGGRRLAEALGKLSPTSEPYGESWEISDQPLHRSRVAAGPHAGQSLHQLMELERPALLGAEAGAYTTFPWLVKFLDARDWLSVQVHPDEHAVRHFGLKDGPKTEAWFVLEAAAASRIYAGLLPGVNETRLRAALREGTVHECLHSFTPQPGECVFLPAGTVHALGGGILLAEVQQTSDATFRLFDWNRRDDKGKSRTLHIEEAIACIDWSRGPVQPVRVADFAAPTPRPARQPLVRCPYFVLEYVRESEAFTCGGIGTLQVVIVLRGGGRLLLAGREEELRAGEAWLLPATMPRARCKPAPELGALLCTLPQGPSEGV